MKTHKAINTLIILAAALFATGEIRADSFRFGIGVTPHGTSLSIGLSDGACAPGAHCRRGPHDDCPPPVVCRPPRGHYETRIERVWVDGYWTRTICRRGRVTRVWHPGYWTERPVRVWVRH